MTLFLESYLMNAADILLGSIEGALLVSWYLLFMALRKKIGKGLFRTISVFFLSLFGALLLVWITLTALSFLITAIF